MKSGEEIMTDSRKSFQDQMQRITDELEPEEALEALGSALRNLIASWMRKSGSIIFWDY